MAQDPPPPTAPGAWLLAASLALLAGFAGWWSRGRLDDGEPAVQPLAASAELDEELAAPPPAPADAPDIVLVTVAGLRADRVGPLSGYDRPTMPWLSEVASRKGQAFRAAVAPSTWSLPSAASLLTGLPPSRHGLVGRPRAAGPGQLEVPVLPEAIGTLAERLRRAGYQTRAVVADPALHRGTGLATGFHAFHNLGAVRAQRVQDSVERMGTERREVDRPLFAWIHYGDPVAPYQANPWVYWWADGDAASDDRRLAELSRLSAPELEPLAHGDALGAIGKLYDSELRLVDDHLQLLWGDLALDDDDLVVIAGLHGEALLEHGAVGHGHALDEELTRVPLVLVWPARWPQPQRFSDPVALADVMPTIAQAAGAPFKVEAKVPARSLAPLIEGTGRDAPPVVAELGTRCRAVYAGALKLVARGDRIAVHDLDADPDERTPLAPDHAGAAALRAAFERPEVTPVATAKVDLSEAAMALLPATVPAPSACD